VSAGFSGGLGAFFAEDQRAEAMEVVGQYAVPHVVAKANEAAEQLPADL